MCVGRAKHFCFFQFLLVLCWYQHATTFAELLLKTKITLLVVLSYGFSTRCDTFDHIKAIWIFCTAAQPRVWYCINTLYILLFFHLPPPLSCVVSHLFCLSQSSFALPLSCSALHLLIVQVLLLYKQRTPFCMYACVCAGIPLLQTSMLLSAFCSSRLADSV